MIVFLQRHTVLVVTVRLQKPNGAVYVWHRLPIKDAWEQDQPVLQTAADLSDSVSLLRPELHGLDPAVELLAAGCPQPVAGLGAHDLELFVVGRVGRIREDVLDALCEDALHQVFSDLGEAGLAPVLKSVDDQKLPQFSKAGELMDRTAKSTRDWLEAGGLDRTAIPDHMRPHTHSH